jgi:EAL domain-containing protein (putative c-di-GMP-specific phosphodiesterase class I)/CheY-like chemotaxis protein
MTAPIAEKLPDPKRSEMSPDNPPATGNGTGDAVAPAQPADAFVIDDEVGICKFVSLTLANLGLRTQSYHNGSHAIAALEHGHPDIVFLDLALEGSDAVEVLRMLGEKRYSGVVQLMSGTSPCLLDDVRRIGARHGLNMRAPLEKPFRGDAIRQAVTSAQRDDPPETTFTLPATVKVSLDEALAEGWLEMWYQPKVDLRTRALVGAEGLIRCRHPVHGVLAPGTFLPQASEAGLNALSEYVVLAALRDWPDLDCAAIPLRVAVNASVSALLKLNLAALIRENRPKDAAWPGLILEVPESEVIKDVDLFHEIATQLRIYGITLAIDDFGEGFSSFARLRELPFGELKLDRGFVDGCAQDARNAGICRAVIELAHQFGVVAVAEGLEDTADVHAVREMGCEMGQGYVFARPMPKSDFVALLRERSRANQGWFA